MILFATHSVDHRECLEKKQYGRSSFRKFFMATGSQKSMKNVGLPLGSLRLEISRFMKIYKKRHQSLGFTLSTECVAKRIMTVGHIENDLE